MPLWTNTIERVLARYVRKTDSCWEWTGHKLFGYGYVSIAGKRGRAHRLLYEALCGPIAVGLTLDHLCRNRACVNPAHLEQVSIKENVLRGIGISAENARKTECKRGHPLHGENLYINPSGERQCKICVRMRKRLWRAGKRASDAREIGVASRRE